MKLCEIYRGVFGDWGWEHLKNDGSVEESREVFASFDECAQDAWRHGYTVGRTRPAQPCIGMTTARPSADMKPALAA